MEELIKKVQHLNDLLKALQAPKMSAAAPKLPKPAAPAMQHENPTVNKTPETKKDPVKVAEQIKDGKARTDNIASAKKNKGKLNMNRLGQWSLNSSGKV